MRATPAGAGAIVRAAASKQQDQQDDDQDGGHAVTPRSESLYSIRMMGARFVAAQARTYYPVSGRDAPLVRPGHQAPLEDGTSFAPPASCVAALKSHRFTLPICQ